MSAAAVSAMAKTASGGGLTVTRIVPTAASAAASAGEDSGDQPRARHVVEDGEAAGDEATAQHEDPGAEGQRQGTQRASVRGRVDPVAGSHGQAHGRHPDAGDDQRDSADENGNRRGGRRLTKVGGSQ